MSFIFDVNRKQMKKKPHTRIRRSRKKNEKEKEEEERAIAAVTNERRATYDRRHVRNKTRSHTRSYKNLIYMCVVHVVAGIVGISVSLALLCVCAVCVLPTRASIHLTQTHKQIVESANSTNEQ